MSVESKPIGVVPFEAKPSDAVPSESLGDGASDTEVEADIGTSSSNTLWVRVCASSMAVKAGPENRSDETDTREQERAMIGVTSPKNGPFEEGDISMAVGVPIKPVFNPMGVFAGLGHAKFPRRNR